MGLFNLLKPKWKHSNPQVRKIAIENLTDLNILDQIAVNDVSEEIRMTVAIRKQELFASIAKKGASETARIEAIEKLDTNKFQKLLVEIAKNDSSKAVRKRALGKLDCVQDQEVLFEIAKMDNSYDVREEAVKKITNQKLLVELTKSGFGFAKVVREQAVMKISDQVALANVAKNDPFYDLRIKAIKKLDADKNQKLFVEIFNSDSREEVRKAALEQITDEKLVDEITNHQKELVSVIQ